MPDQKTLKDTYQEASAKVSELNRNLALGGLGIIWIFKYSDSNSKILPDILVYALFFLVITLLLDLLHYIWRTVVIHHVYNKTVKKKLETAEYPNYLRNLSWLFFYGKVGTMITAYVLIFIFLREKL